jgi:hypothetical protein
VRRQLLRFGIPARRRGPAPGRFRRMGGEAFGGWSADIAYVVGLIATDGNLGRRTAAISIVSKDVDLLETVRSCLGVRTAIKPHRGGYSNRCHHLAWRDRMFHDWLSSIGLTPAKSLTLGPLAIPDRYFADFFRGCIDGDGSVLTYTDRYHTTNERTVHIRSSLRLDRIGQSTIHRVASGYSAPPDRRHGINRRQASGRKEPGVASSLRQGSVHPAPRVDLLCAACPMPPAKAHHG